MARSTYLRQGETPEGYLLRCEAAKLSSVVIFDVAIQPIDNLLDHPFITVLDSLVNLIAIPKSILTVNVQIVVIFIISRVLNIIFVVLRVTRLLLVELGEDSLKKGKNWSFNYEKYAPSQQDSKHVQSNECV